MADASWTWMIYLATHNNAAEVGEESVARMRTVAPNQAVRVLVQGKNDERMPMWVAEQYATAAGTASTYILLEGNHFVLLKQADRVQAAIADWISLQEARAR